MQYLCMHTCITFSDYIYSYIYITYTLLIYCIAGRMAETNITDIFIFLWLHSPSSSRRRYLSEGVYLSNGGVAGDNQSANRLLPAGADGAGIRFSILDCTHLTYSHAVNSITLLFTIFLSLYLLSFLQCALSAMLSASIQCTR